MTPVARGGGAGTIPRMGAGVSYLRRRRTGFAAALLSVAGCAAAGPGPYYTDPARRDADLKTICETRSFALGRPTGVKPAPRGDAVLFLRGGPRDRVQSLYEFDAATGATRVVLTAEGLLKGGGEEVTAEEQARRERQRITTQGITGYQISDDGGLLLAPLSGRLFVVERNGGAVHELPGVRDALDPRFSPDGRWVSYVVDYDLHCMDWRTGEVRRLTTGGGEDTPNGLSEFVAQEEMHRHEGYWWSPDATRVAYQSSDLRAVERLTIADPAQPWRAPQSWRYPRAGTNNAKVRLHVVSVAGGSPTAVGWDDQRYPYLAAVAWEKNAPLTLLVQTRDQRDQLLLRVDAETGATSELLREHDDAWLNLFSGMPRWLESGRGLLWITESEGECRLWVHESNDRRTRPLNGDEFRLRGLIDCDEAGRRVLVSGSDDPTQSHVYELPLDGGPSRRLTDEPGQHGWTCSKDHSLYVASIAGPRLTRKQIVFRRDGRRIGELPSVGEEPGYWPAVEFARVGPRGEFDTAVVRPRNFRAGVKYPVIVDVYGGPGSGVVHRDARAYFLAQWYADQGFVVVSADNRGVKNRGREWERAIKGNFAEAPLDDQVAALRALGARFGEMDLSRVGIKGWSFGGYMAALAVLRRGDVFHAAAAGAPVVDWHDYDTHYTERFLDTPQANPEGYRRSSLLTYVEGLSRPLLVIHGTADDNVYFGNALRLVDALFRAGKSFEFVPLAGYTHLVPDAEMRGRVESRIAAFFRRGLRGE